MKVVLFALLMSASSFSVSVGTIEKNKQSFSCIKKIEKLGTNWGARGKWKLFITGSGELGIKKNTTKFAHWINIEKKGAHEVASLINPLQVQQAIFDPKKDCESKLRSYAHKQYSNPRGMSDARLLSTMASNRNGIILIWSPGMGHSFTAIKRMRELAKEKGLPISLVMDPFASVKHARKRLKEENIIVKDIYPLSSLELTQREAMMHYPAFFVYKNARIVGNIVPGLMTKHSYKRKVNELLK